MSAKKIVVAGIGYVGLPAALLLAKSGFKVTGYDINEKTVNEVNARTIKTEREIEELLNDEKVKENFMASSTLEKADVFIVAVPTPLHERKKIANLDALVSCIKSISEVMEKGNLIIIESTIPPLTCRELVKPILEQKGFEAGSDIYLVHCPERLLPGNVYYEITTNNRLIGGINEKSAEMAKEIYRTFVQGEIVITDDKTAELCKLIENTYRDVNIALANELNEVCTSIGVDVSEAIRLANMHPRVNVLYPGIGVGGHCLPIDPWFINEASPFECHIIQTARRINDAVPEKMAARIRKKVSGNRNGKILLLGKTYKEETNDIRESPAIKIYENLKADGYNVTAYDPFVDELTTEEVDRLIDESDFVFLLVKHKRILEILNLEERKENIVCL